LDQLAAFVRLTQDKRYRRAAILHQQIRQTLSAFDAPRYLPGLFGDYLSALLAHGSKLKPRASAESGSDDLEHETLVQLCRVDLPRFLHGGDR
jgi:hypothetical protein